MTKSDEKIIVAIKKSLDLVETSSSHVETIQLTWRSPCLRIPFLSCLLRVRIVTQMLGVYIYKCGHYTFCTWL